MEDVKLSLKPGETFAGKYRVDRILGEGGMGVVLGATHLLTQDRVALKFLLPQAAEHPDIRQRFLNEARAAVQNAEIHLTRGQLAQAVAALAPLDAAALSQAATWIIHARSRIAIDQAATELVNRVMAQALTR